MEQSMEGVANGLAGDASPAPHKEVTMADAPEESAASPMPQMSADSPAPGRTGTPAQASRAPSAPPEPSYVPSEATPHGDPTRRYLNSKVTGALLVGMKKLAKEQPEDPLRVLGEFLILKSKELEEKN